MAWPGTLTQQQQDSLLEWIKLLRTVSGELARTMNHLQALNTEYNGTQSANLAGLDNDDVIPLDSNYDGAEALTKTDVVNLVSYAQSVVGLDGQGGVNTQAHRQNLAKAAGEQNLIG